MRFKVMMLSGKLWYVQHVRTRKYYFERYTEQKDAEMVAKTLEERKCDEDWLIRTEFFIRTSYCSTTYGFVGEIPKELVITNDRDNFWLIEHEETCTYLVFKYADPDEAQRVTDNLLKHWANNPKAKAEAMEKGYFVSNRDFIREQIRL